MIGNEREDGRSGTAARKRVAEPNAPDEPDSQGEQLVRKTR